MKDLVAMGPKLPVGHKRRGWQNGDPPGSEKPRGKSAYQRKGSRDGKTLTPSEQRQKNVLMRQFMRNPEGPGGNTEAYRASPVWCSCGRGMNRRAADGSTVPCFRCEADGKVA